MVVSNWKSVDGQRMSRRFVGREYATVNLSIFIDSPERGLCILSNPRSSSFFVDCEGGIRSGVFDDVCVLELRSGGVLGVGGSEGVVVCEGEEEEEEEEREGAEALVVLMLLLLLWEVFV